MPALVYKSDDFDDQVEERRAAVKMIIDALVAARHPEVMDTYGMPRSFFETQIVEVLDPSHPMKPVTKKLRKLPRGSVLRGKSPQG